jgi:hypothetical protein
MILAMRRVLLLGVLFLSLAGCDLLGGGNTAGSSTVANVPTDTPVAVGTGTPASTDATPTSAPAVTPTPSDNGTPTPKNCPSDFNRDGLLGYVGQMLISQPHFAYLSYMGLRLPDTLTGGAPYMATAASSTDPFDAGVVGDPSPAVLAADQFTSGQPSLGASGSGIIVRICNSSSSTTHTLAGLGLQIAGFTAASGSNLNIQAGCDTTVTAKIGPTGGCGGALTGADTFEATWPTGSAVNAFVTLAQLSNSSASGGFANLPVTLKPGQDYTAFIGTNYPGQPGVYTFELGMQTDSNPMYFVGGNTFPLFMAAGAHIWSGAACWNNPTWKAQVQASTSGFFLCPQA